MPTYRVNVEDADDKWARDVFAGSAAGAAEDYVRDYGTDDDSESVVVTAVDGVPCYFVFDVEVRTEREYTAELRADAPGDQA